MGLTIDLGITTYNLGDLNTTEDNEAYCAAVAEALAEQYPGARVSVGLISGTAEDSVDVSGVDDATAAEIETTIGEISQSVWNNADY